MTRSRRKISLYVCIISILVWPLVSYAITSTEVFDTVKQSIVVVTTFDLDGNFLRQGSGVLISTNIVATNCHVIESGYSFKVGREDELVSATLHAFDDKKDICLLQIESIHGNPAKMGSTANLKVGDVVYAVGAPQGLELSLSNGIVSQLRLGPPPIIQTTAAISSGSSGGGLFNDEGLLIGLTTLYLNIGQNLNFAIPVEWINEVKPIRVIDYKNDTDWLMSTAICEMLEAWDNMLVHSLRWTNKQPQNSNAWCYLGIAHSHLNQHNSAIQSFNKSISLNPNNTYAWFNLGCAYISIKDHDRAIESFRETIRIDKDYVEAWEKLGVSYNLAARYFDAIAARREAVRLNPKSSDLWLGLGLNYQKVMRYEEAVVAYKQAILIDPNSLIAWIGLGDVYGKQMRYNDAITAYKKAINIDPKNTWARLGLAFTYSEIKQYDAAIRTFQEAVKINPKFIQAWHFLGITYLRTGNRAAALDIANHLRSIDPEAADKLFDIIVPR